MSKTNNFLSEMNIKASKSYP